MAKEENINDSDYILYTGLPEDEQPKLIFCDTYGENYYILGFCAGKEITHWITGIVATLGGIGGALSYFLG
jgi:hypothetical protein